jgi:hypothetical protein
MDKQKGKSESEVKGCISNRPVPPFSSGLEVRRFPIGQLRAYQETGLIFPESTQHKITGSISSTHPSTLPSTQSPVSDPGMMANPHVCSWLSRAIFTRSVDYHLECCIEARFLKMARTGSTLRFWQESVNKKFQGVIYELKVHS